MKNKNISVQNWLGIENVLKDGIIKLKNNKYVKLIKIIPINFNLKSNFEKEAILSSYKVFLKTCNFNIQILIQSNKQDLNNNIKNIEENLKRENKDFLNKIGKNYFDFINEINSFKTSSSKDFYIIISNEKISENTLEELVIEELNDNYFKIKECLTRCGNSVKSINSKKEVLEILYSFLNTRIFIL